MDADGTMSTLPHVHPTVVHMLIDAAIRAPQREALVFAGERLNYTEYLRCVIGFAQELGGYGVAGGRVALVMRNSVDLCIAMFAIHMAGAQATPLNPIYTEHELEPMLGDADVTVLLCDHDVSDIGRPEGGGDPGRPLAEAAEQVVQVADQLRHLLEAFLEMIR